MNRLLLAILLLACPVTVIAQNSERGFKKYSKYYTALNEPSIAQEPAEDIVRFLWLRTFDNPVVIKVIHRNDSVTVNWKRTDGQGGYEPGGLIVDETKTLSRKEWEDILQLSADEGFWELNTDDDKISGFDGAQYVLEVRKGKNYHIVERWGGYDIGRICLYLFGLTDIDPKQEYMNASRRALEKHFASNPGKDALVEQAMKDVDADNGYDLMIPERAEKWMETTARRGRLATEAGKGNIVPVRVEY